MSASIQQLESLLTRELSRVVIGAEAAIRAVTIALIARGHVLVQGVPGLGKTLLAKSLAQVLGGEFKRIQGTPDLMPGDIIGTHIFDEAQRNFVFRPGPIFADVVLVDEINRAGPKTQSALLEAMEERQVSVDREVFALPEDFLVLATQNPREFEGTYPLPESQLDRFMLRIDITYPARDAEARVLQQYGWRMTAFGTTGSVPALATLKSADSPPTPAAAARGVGSTPASSGADSPAFATASASATAAGVANTSVSATALVPNIPLAQLDRSLLARAREEAEKVHVSEALTAYVLDLARASREHSRVALGLSTRGALALIKAARIAAGLRGSEFVSPDDVKEVAVWVMAHRIVLTPEAALEGTGNVELVTTLIGEVPVPR
jgi:MoxR-like ATPase